MRSLVVVNLMHTIQLLLTLLCFLGLAHAVPLRLDEVWRSHLRNPLYDLRRAFDLWSKLDAPNNQCFCFDSPEYPHVGFVQCSPVFTDLLRSPGASLPRRYDGITTNPAYLRRGPCTIIFGTRRDGSVIHTSLQQIVSSARDTLTTCRKDSRGGLNNLTPDGKWYVAVRGGKISSLSLPGHGNGTLSQQ